VYFDISVFRYIETEYRMFSHYHGHGGGFRHARRGRSADGEGFGRHGWHGGRHGGGRGLARFFAHGDLRIVILHLISESPRHGYDIIKSVEELTGGAYSPSPGVVYPTLTLLEEMDHVTVTADGAKKLYAITDEGRAFLEANRAPLDALLGRLTGASGERRHMPRIMRAMANVKLALRMRIGRGSLSDAEVDAIAAILDEAADKLERA
jgi:DNA-binding PadR family transcriptional regulator